MPDETTEVLTAPEPKVPTPLDPPKVFYNLIWRVPPLVVDTQEAADALDPAEWTTDPPPAARKEEYPKLMFNINVTPRIVDDAKEQVALGGDWREFSLPQALVTAAQAKLDAAKN